MAKAEVSTVKAGAKAVVKAVGGLHPDAALERLEPMSAATRQGLRKRILLAARIALMRKALVAPARVTEVVVPVEEPVVEAPPPAPPPPPPPAPKPLPKGRIMSINLDDLSSMLTEPVEPEPKPEAAPSSEFAALDWGEVAAITDGSGGQDLPLDPAAVADEGDAVAAKPGKSSRGKKRGAVVAIKDGGEAADPFAAMAELQAMDAEDAPSGAEGAAPAAASAMIDPMAAFAALAAAEEDEAPARPDSMTDPSAAFAALAEAEEAEAKAVVPKARAVVDPMAAFAEMAEEVVPVEAVTVTDPGAAFAALAEAEEAEAKAVVPKAQPIADPFAAFAELEAAEDQAAQEIAPNAKPPVIDAGAAFAALDAAREEEARAIAPAAGKPKPLAIDLSAQFAAMGDED
jgi:hypothetical protein